MIEGQHVIYVDPTAVARQALVTAVHGTGETPSINVVLVDHDPNQRDSYGAKIKRETSVVHQSNQSARGNYWKLPS